MSRLNEIIDFYRNDTVSASQRHEFMRSFPKSGYDLIQRIDPKAWVLDIGCGDNLFRPHLPNLIGIDPATDAADICVSLQHYQPDRLFDVALCLGSIQGDDTEVRDQIAKIRDLLTDCGRIYWRCMPDPPPYAVPDWMSLWTFDRHRKLAHDFGFEVIDLAWELRPPPKSARIYAEWIKRN